MWGWGGIFGRMTDPEALLLQGRGCNSEGKPCGKCLRASVKAEHICLSLRPWGKKKEVRGAKNREKRKKRRSGDGDGEGEAKVGRGEEGSPFGRAPCHFPSWPLHLTISYFSSIYNLFSVLSGWPDLTPTSLAHTSSLLLPLFIWSQPLCLPLFLWISTVMSLPLCLQLLLFFAPFHYIEEYLNKWKKHRKLMNFLHFISYTFPFIYVTLSVYAFDI